MLLIHAMVHVETLQSHKLTGPSALSLTKYITLHVYYDYIGSLVPQSGMRISAFDAA